MAKDSFCCGLRSQKPNLKSFHLTGEETPEGPIFIQEPFDVTYSESSDQSEVLLNCTARGHPLPFYRSVSFFPQLHLILNDM